ncbi:hypothetical protein LUZ60_012183 [Juncus effusus]|nr:hypothetical protein LUZ60_012183 [Juncus effusus]
MDQTQFSTPQPSNSTSLLVLALSILGILTISLLLLLYYLFVTKCCRFSWYRSSTDTISPRWLYYRSDNLILDSTSIEGRGLSESSIQAIPTIRYKKDGKKIGFHECAVCINEFRDEERIRVLPSCFHVFHLDCIDTWLQNNANCPLCRAPVTCCASDLMNLAGPTSQEVANGNNNDIVIDVRDEELHGSNFQEIGEKNERKLKSFGVSLGDECLNSRNKEDLDFVPMRRSFSMDSSSDAQLYIALQKILQSNSDSSDNSSNNYDGLGKLKRGFFSFNQNRCSRSAILPI